MNFKELIRAYIKEHNLQDTALIENELLIKNVLLEARRSKSSMYDELSVSSSIEANLTPEDVASFPFYRNKDGSKSTKNGKSSQELESINKEQADVFNKIIEKVKQIAADNKSDTIDKEQFESAALSVFQAAGQWVHVRKWNKRVAENLLIFTKGVFKPVKKEALSNVVPPDIDKGLSPDLQDETPINTAEEEPTKPLKSKVPSASSSKFDTMLKNNEPGAEEPEAATDYLEVLPDATISKEEMPSRDDRVLAKWLLYLISQDIPGTHNKESIISVATEEDSSVSSEEVASMLNKLIAAGKIKLVPKAEEGEGVPDSSEEEPANYSDMRDVTDRELGFTRKGFGGDRPEYDY